MTEQIPCPSCGTDTDLFEFCGHSRDPLCPRCCGNGEHVVYGGGAA